MDFGTLLHVAQQKTQNNKNEVKYYSTKFEPPKKEERSKSQLSANIQKFLARREAEEKQKQEEARIKKLELLSLRAQDRKAKKRIQCMLQRTKSANKSVIDDAIDKNDTAVTLAGPSQPDEDDYGYESQESAAIYAKMMEKYNSMPEESKFTDSKRKVSTNLASTKERVKAALLREEEEAHLPHKRKRKMKTDDETKPIDNNNGYKESEKNDVEKPKVKRPPPPVLNFNDLLKIAEKKQFEPIVIEQKKVDSDEPLMTKKQRREYEKEKAWRESREARLRAALTAPPKKDNQKTCNLENRIPKVNHSADDSRRTTSSTSSATTANMKKLGTIPKHGKVDVSKKVDSAFKKPLPVSSKDDRLKLKPSNDKQQKPRQYLPGDLRAKQDSQETKPRQYLPGDLRAKQQDVVAKPKQNPPISKQDSSKPKQYLPGDIRAKQDNKKPTETSIKPKSTDLKPKQFPPADLKPKQFPPADLKPKQFPPADLKPKQFPPTDVRRLEMKRKPPPKRPIIADDDSEYDSEMDDFIDDGPLEGEADYSKHIKEIFGYDKSRYRHLDDEDDTAMESKFSTILKEEYISTKIGIMEDLEDIRKEAEEKKRKAMLMKKKTTKR